MRNMTTKSTLKSELVEAKTLGFTVGRLTRNPYMRLEDGTSLIWLAGKLIAIVSTETFFGTGSYLKCWKSSDTNKPCAAMTSTQIDSDGIGKHTEIYYREIFKQEIKTLADKYRVSEAEIAVDHINHIRGDCRDYNLRLATAAQNNQNRSKTKIERAFFTLEDLEKNLASGKWKPIK